jgi:hypothetical protein
MHPRTRQRIAKWGLESYLDNIIVTPPLGYFEFLGLLMYSATMLTDSGGVQEEAFTLKIPTVTLRYNTEWLETLTGGINVLAGADPPNHNKPHLQPTKPIRSNKESRYKQPPRRWPRRQKNSEGSKKLRREWAQDRRARLKEDAFCNLQAHTGSSNGSAKCRSAD